ncbi:ankyrin repeat domain-containing protein [Calycomorphotria hydatis]|uniref:Ankyrin repeats (3 copies) n=1 Tax=Calycomorphotria hydatis TaxID=2528027 RepID=A0A517T7M3_9PLAN|nr:ankyrin repeat domain-containing protein [Calycomorphotria hydatis]QDT64373.1 Ankyrin repeats (3 copies) [Calycomorphotria hydatis]
MIDSKLMDACEAIIDGDLQTLSSLVGTVIPPTYKTPSDNWNLLHLGLVSVQNLPHIDSIKYLIESGVDVNAIDKSGWTPLHFAARTSDTDVVRALVSAGADVNAENDKGEVPLNLSLMRKPWNLLVVEALLKAGADGGRIKKFATVVASPQKEDLLALIDKYA